MGLGTRPILAMGSFDGVTLSSADVYFCDYRKSATPPLLFSQAVHHDCCLFWLEKSSASEVTMSATPHLFPYSRYMMTVRSFMMITPPKSKG